MLLKTKYIVMRLLDNLYELREWKSPVNLIFYKGYEIFLWIRPFLYYEILTYDLVKLTILF